MAGVVCKTEVACLGIEPVACIRMRYQGGICTTRMTTR